MSITSAMFTGVSGLLGNAEGINVIGNNLSNVNTVGFKSGRMLFSDMLSVSIGNNSQIGRGTQIQKVDNIFSQGSFENSEVVTDLAIQGNSFFALKAPTQASPLTAQNTATLTRAGAFRLDAAKYLVNPDGYQVVDTSGSAIQFTDNAEAIQTALTAYTPTVTTATASMLPATAAAVYQTPAANAATAATNALTAAQTGLAAARAASAAATSSGDAASIIAAATAVTDATAAVTAAQSLVAMSTTATTNARSASLAASALSTAAGNLSANPNDANANAASVANTTAGSALKGANTSLSAMQQAFNSVASALVTSAGSLEAVGAALTSSGNTKNGGIGLTGPGDSDIAAGTIASTAALLLCNPVTGPAATATSGAALDALTAGSAVTAAIAAAAASLATANTDNTAAATAFSIFNSASAAAFSKVSKVESDGLMTYVGKYGDTYYYDATNAIGIPTATATAAQIAACQRIAVINPSNPGGMDKLGGTLYKINTFSGVQTSGFSISNNKINGTTEKLFSNSLEQSNVDMAAQFVKMILTQRAYSANSKTITTADEMTQEVLNLKR